MKTDKRWRLMLLVAALAAVAFGEWQAGAAVSPCSAPTVSWDGGGDGTSWSDSDNWTGDAVPGPSAVVCVASGSASSVQLGGDQSVTSVEVQVPLTINGNLSISSVGLLSGATLAGGAITGPGNVTLLGAGTWSGGSLTGAGATNVAAGASLTVPASSFVQLEDNRVLNNLGTVTIADSAQLYAGMSAVLNNSGTLTVGDGVSLYGIYYPGADSTPLLLHNTGTISKSSGTGTSYVTARMDNDGSITASAGILSLSGADQSDASSAGSFAGTGTGQVALGGGAFTLADGASLDHVAIAAAVTVPASSTVAASNVVMTAGSLTGPGTVNLTGSSTWSGGDMTGTGTTAVASGASLALAPSAFVQLESGRTLSNAGTLSLGDGAQLYSGMSAQLQNSGTLAFGDGVSLYGIYYPGADTTPMLLHNTGTVTKNSGANTSYLTARLDNDGTLTASSGTLSVTAADPGDVPASSSGTFSRSASGELVLAGGSVTTGGNVTFAGATLAGASITVPAGSSLSGNLTMTSGTLTGAGAVNLTGSSSWTGGEMTGLGTTSVAPGASLAVPPSSFVQLEAGRTLSNAGTMTLGDNAQVYSGGSAQLQNSGTLALADGVSLYGVYFPGADDTPMLLHNTGTLTKNSGANVSYITARLANDGLLTASSGDLQIAISDAGATPLISTGAVTSTGSGQMHLIGGSYVTGSGASLSAAVVSGADVTASAGTSLSAASVQLVGGSLGGPGDVTYSGTSTWALGSVRGPGTAKVLNGATVSVPDGNQVSLAAAGALLNQGTLHIAGGLTGAEGTRIANTGTLDLPGGGVVYGQNGGLPLLIDNAGLISKSDAGDASVIADLDNEGTVRATNGTLTLQGAGGDVVSHGLFQAVSPGALRFGGSVRIGDGSVLDHLVLDTGEVVTSGTVTAKSCTLAGGEISGSGDVVIDTGMTAEGGIMSGTGATVVPPGTTLLVQDGPSNPLTLSGSRLLSIGGHLNWTGGNVEVYDGAFVDNAGLVDLAPQAVLSGYDSLLYNGGTVRKASGVGTTTLSVPFDNEGTLESDAGQLAVSGLLNFSDTGQSLTGGRYVAKGGTLDLPGGITTNAADLVWDGAGSELQSGGTDVLQQLTRNAPAGRLTLQGGASRSGANFVNAGRVVVSTGSTLATTDTYNQPSGTTTVNGTLTPGGAGAALAGGHLRGSGTVSGPVTLAGASLEPGTTGTTGVLTVTGNYAQSAASRLVARVNGPTAGAQYDVLNVGGTATLGGTLNVVTGDAYQPTLNDAFAVVSAGSVTGTFSSISSSGLPTGQSYTAGYGASSVTVHVTNGGSGLRSGGTPAPVVEPSGPTEPAADGPRPTGPATGTAQVPVDGQPAKPLATATSRDTGHAAATKHAAAAHRRAVEHRRQATARQQQAAAQVRSGASHRRTAMSLLDPSSSDGRAGDVGLGLVLLSSLGFGIVVRRRRV